MRNRPSHMVITRKTEIEDSEHEASNLTRQGVMEWNDEESASP